MESCVAACDGIKNARVGDPRAMMKPVGGWVGDLDRGGRWHRLLKMVIFPT